MGTLYIVSTPIGNLEDITLRALRLLREVSLIAAEDTRHTRKLLNHFEISTPTTSYHQHSGRVRTDQIMQALQTGDVALVTDAGTPALSDPGTELVSAAASAGYPVVPVPGASALLSLVAASGMAASRFAYLGFLPRKGKERRLAITQAAATGWPLIIYESPHRLAATLVDLKDAMGDRDAVVGRELTKLHEEIFRGRLSDAYEHFSKAEVRGEVTVMVEGGAAEEAAPYGQENLDDLLSGFRAEGFTAKEAARKASEAAGVSTREAYNRLILLDRQTDKEQKE